jgi:hypothetical protein
VLYFLRDPHCACRYRPVHYVPTHGHQTFKGTERNLYQILNVPVYLYMSFVLYDVHKVTEWGALSVCLSFHMRLKGVAQLKNPMTSSDFEPATFHFVA